MGVIPNSRKKYLEIKLGPLNSILKKNTSNMVLTVKILQNFQQIGIFIDYEAREIMHLVASVRLFVCVCV